MEAHSNGMASQSPAAAELHNEYGTETKKGGDYGNSEQEIQNQIYGAFIGRDADE